jgi:hypothetical protein
MASPRAEEVTLIIEKVAAQMRESGVAYVKIDGIEVILNTEHARKYAPPIEEERREPVVEQQQRLAALGGHYYHQSLWPAGVPDYMTKRQKDEQ